MPSQKTGGSDVLTVRGTDALHHHHDHDHRDVNKNAQHGDALRIMLGSILAPKRPSLSHSSSGTASPAHSFSHSSPTNSAPQHASANPLTPHHPFGYPHVHPYPPYPHTPSHHSHPHHSHPHPAHHAPGHQQSHGQSLPRTPSKLGLSSEHDKGAYPPTSSSAHSSQHPSPIYEAPSFFSPRPGRMSRSASTANSIPRLPSSGQVTSSDHHAPVESPIPVSASAPEIVVTANPSSPVPATVDMLPRSNGNSLPGSGSGTPKNKFIETLEGKSAWDALIHGSFS